MRIQSTIPDLAYRWTAGLILLGGFILSPVMGQEIAVPSAAQRSAEEAAAESTHETSLRTAAGRGDARAMYDLYALLRGRDFTRANLPEVKSLLLKAADGGDWRAMRALADHYARGEGVEKDPALAGAWKQKAAATIATKADAGDVRAMISLAVRLRMDGKYTDAAGWYRKAGESGDAEAMYELAQMTLLQGDKFGAKPSDGWILMEKAGKAGSVPAMMQLAIRAERARPARGDEAISWYTRGAEAGDPDAMRELGRIYWDGVLVGADAGKAIGWYNKAAVRDGRGLASIGDIFASGKIVPRDDAAAVGWYRKAADAGEAEGMYDLASSLMAGVGVAKDPAEAQAWLVRAADAGSDDANHALLNLGIERAPHAMSMKLPEVKLEHVGLADTVQFLADISGANIDVDWPALDGAGVKRDVPVDVHLQNISVQDALAQVVAVAGQGKIAVGIVGGEVIVSTPAATRSLTAMRARHRVKALPPEFLARMQRRLPDVKFDRVSLSDVMDFLRDVSGIKIEMPAEILKAAKLTPETPISIQARNMSFNIVLEQILHSAGGDPPLDYDEQDGKMTIITGPRD